MRNSKSSLLTDRMVSVGFMTAVILLAIGFTRNEARRHDVSNIDLQSTLTTVENSNVFFYTKAIATMAQTSVSLSYDFGSYEPQLIWLRLAATNGAPISRLVYHPQLAKLDWQAVATPQVTLYQRQPRFSTLDEFLADPPSGDRIALESSLSNDELYSTLEARTFSDSLDTTAIDYIVTTYKPGESEYGFYTYRTQLDATQARVDVNGRLSWHIDSPEASAENPVSVGNLKIDYQQSP